MYARGMSAREIVGHLRELYGIEVSPDLISAVTDAVLDGIATWQARPLAAARSDEKDRSHHIMHVCGSGSTAVPGGRKHRRDQRPFAVGQIAWKTQAITVMLSTSGSSPGHRKPHLIQNQKGITTC